MTTFAEQQGPCWATTYNRAACQWWWRSCSGWLLNIVGRIRGELHGLMAVPTSSLISAGPRTRSNHRYKFKYTLASTAVYRNSFYFRKIPGGTTLTKKPPRGLPSNASRVACFSPPSRGHRPDTPYWGFVELSTTFQIQFQILTRQLLVMSTVNTRKKLSTSLF